MDNNIFKKQAIPFTQVPNELLYDPRISFKAKGLWAYMSAKPEGWQFSADRISNETKEERKAVLAGLKELVEFGYLTAKKCSNGRMEYTLHYTTVKPAEQTAPETKVESPMFPKKEEAPRKPSDVGMRPKREDYDSDEAYEEATYKWNTVSITKLDKT